MLFLLNRFLNPCGKILLQYATWQFQMSFGDDQPTFDELMEVVQRQQEVIEIFEQQTEASNREKAKMAEESEKKSEIIRLMETSEALLKDEIEALRNSKDEIGRPEEQGRVDSELETIEELRLKCKELSYEVGKLKTQQTSLEIELETHKKNNEFTKNELEEERKQRQLEKDRLISNHQLIEQQLKQNNEDLQKSLKTSQIELTGLKTDLEMREHRGKQLERLYEDLMEEINETRKEKSMVMVRCSTMTAEIAELKAKIQNLKGKMPRHDGDIEDMSKLLADQSHLIAALREETKLLARKIEVDSREYRTSLKLLKQDKRELEQRIEAFLRVD